MALAQKLIVEVPSAGGVASGMWTKKGMGKGGGIRRGGCDEYETSSEFPRGFE